eukprot:TCONS_00043472-protein
MPRSSQRIREKTVIQADLKLSNRFVLPSTDQAVRQVPRKSNDNTTRTQTSEIVHNLSSHKLSTAELSLLERGLIFCPSSPSPDPEQLLDDVHAYCRKQRLRYQFRNLVDEHDEKSTNPENACEETERCQMKSTYRNPYYDPVDDSECPNLENYLSCIKSDIVKLLADDSKRPKSNITREEQHSLEKLSRDRNIIVQKADKGGKIVVMNRTDYIVACNDQLENKHFYEQLDTDSNQNYADTIRKEIDNLKSKSKITDKEHIVLTEHLSNPRTPVFYGLPKLHKNFSKFPPLRPIVSGFSSCSNRLSEFLDGFLKYQAQKTNSYIRDTKDFLVRLADLPSLPSNTILVTMDVASLYTNIDHEEGANACFDHLEQRNKKSISSSYLKKLILLVLRSNVFRFGCNIYHQIKGTAMGTPMAPNYANLFMASLETKMLDEYYELTKLRPLVWYCYIDDIFFIWTHGNESLNQFIDFCNNFSKSRKMKSTIQYETHQSTDSVNFLDVEVRFRDSTIQTSVYSKATDAHLYLNAKSCHPNHVIRNIPKGQFIRIRRICTNVADYINHGKQLL